MTNARASRAKSIPKPALPAKLTPADLECHTRMLAGLTEAQQLQERVRDLHGAFRVWAQEVHERYQIPAGAPGVMPDGTINRGG